MLKSYNGLTQQMFEKPFRDMLFSIYNFAEEEFYIHGLKNLGFDSDIDNLEFMSLDTDNVTNGKKGILPIVIKPKSVDLEDVLKERK